MCIENTHFKYLKNYYRDLRVEVTHLFLEWGQTNPLFDRQVEKNRMQHLLF